MTTGGIVVSIFGDLKVADGESSKYSKWVRDAIKCRAWTTSKGYEKLQNVEHGRHRKGYETQMSSLDDIKTAQEP